MKDLTPEEYRKIKKAIFPYGNKIYYIQKLNYGYYIECGGEVTYELTLDTRFNVIDYSIKCNGCK